jgi:hypothetical protein
MAWTKCKPTKQGYYWYRNSANDPDPEVIHLDENGSLWAPGWECEIVVGEMSFDRMSVVNGEFWDTPLVPPL